MALAQKVCADIYSGVHTYELDELAAQTCAALTTDSGDYGILASRLAISNHHKRTSPSFSETIQILMDNKNKNGTYYLYSYCLHPKDIQPSGLCNMSRIDDKLLQLETQYIKNDLNINKKIEVDIFNVNYNFLLIQKGKCKLMF